MAAVMPMPQPLVEERELKVPIAQPFPRFGHLEFPETGKIVGTGWLPDVPDLRDYTEEHPAVAQMVERLGIARAKKMKGALLGKIDLRQWCSPIEDQRNLGSCTANAAVGIVEYFERRAFGKHIDGSRLFVYKTTRDLMGLVGDTGAYLRTTMASLVLFGLPPEAYWPYTDKQQPGIAGERTFDEEPTVFVYEMADNFEAMNYVCHDPFGTPVPPANVLSSIKTYLAAGIPTMFGFYIFPSHSQTDVKGAFPYPAPGERAFAGHAVAAVGYDDNLKIKNLASGQEEVGALLIRNSWGSTWGDNGYGWLPYKYVLSQLAQDFWSLLGMKWINMGGFGLTV